MSKRVLVTGASSGIGKAIAIYLAENGYKVYGVARRVEKLNELKRYGITPIPMDLNDEASMIAGIETVVQQSGGVDILVNNAGAGYYGALEDMSLADAKYQMEINVFAAARLIQWVLPQMRKNRFGKIINISSVGGKVTLPMGSWYHASKFAVEGLSDALRKEVQSFGIDVIVIEPGGVKSEMTGLGSEYLTKVSGNTAYAGLAKRVRSMYDTTAKNASDPVVIAKLVLKGIEAKKPKTRYAGASGAKLLLFMRKLLSDRMFDKVTMSQLK